MGVGVERREGVEKKEGRSEEKGSGRGVGKKKAGSLIEGDPAEKFGGNLLSRKLYMHYHRQCGV